MCGPPAINQYDGWAGCAAGILFCLFVDPWRQHAALHQLGYDGQLAATGHWQLTSIGSPLVTALRNVWVLYQALAGWLNSLNLLGTLLPGIKGIVTLTP